MAMNNGVSGGEYLRIGTYGAYPQLSPRQTETGWRHAASLTHLRCNFRDNGGRHVDSKIP